MSGNPGRIPTAPFVITSLWLSLTILLPTSADAWGCRGHQTVALIAEKHLTPEARLLVYKLLSENPSDAKLGNYCGDSLHDAMASAATWADAVRGEKGNGPWHYINIPRGAPGEPLEKYCGKNGCVTRALAEQLAILNDSAAPPAKRTDALRYVIHFLGDLHQPLHASTNGDQGGNCVPLKYFRREPHEYHHAFSPNLHSIWDVAILERDMQSADPAEYAAMLEETFHTEIKVWEKAGIHIDEWAWESHELAENTVYGQLRPKITIEANVSVPACTDDANIGERMLDKHITVGDSYQNKTAPIVELRIAQAGIRLALVLNAAATSKKP